MNEKKKLKDLVVQIMNQKSMNYDDWLHMQHMIFVTDNTDLIRDALGAATNKEKTKE